MVGASRRDDWPRLLDLLEVSSWLPITHSLAEVLQDHDLAVSGRLGAEGGYWGYLDSVGAPVGRAGGGDHHQGGQVVELWA